MMKKSLLTDLTLIEVMPGKRFSLGVLQNLLPDVDTALFFAKAYDMNYTAASRLLGKLFPNNNVIQELFTGNHSTELQGYITQLQDEVPDYLRPEPDGTLGFNGPAPQGQILPLLWKQLEVGVAQSIQEVANKIVGVLDRLPAKEGQMVFRHLNQLNRQRPKAAFGTFGAQIIHPVQAQNLVIFDVSGSMTEHTVKTIVDDVVALSYKANAHLAIVSNNMYYWTPGTYTTKSVLAMAEYGGTKYATLRPLFDQDWGTVVTIADYDSYHDARSIIGSSPGRIGQVLDISLVNTPTFMAECVGQLADEVRPLLVANSYQASHI